LPIFAHEAPAHPWLGFSVPLRSGQEGTEQTVALMRKLVDQALNDAGFVRKAIDIVRAVPAYDEMGELRALYDWVKSSIRFVKDPVTKEKLYPPQELLKIRAGDCDDISMLLGALAIAIGYPARLVTIAANAAQPSEFSHVYVEAEAPPHSGNWVPLDAAREDSRFAVAPAMFYRKRAWSLTDSSFTDLSGNRCFVHANTVRPGLGSYGHVRRFRSRLLAGLGQDDGGGGGIDWGSIVSQSIAEIPTVISAATGKSSQVRGPYGSFATGYTPGYGVPPAGYVSPGPMASVSAFGSPLLWLLGGGILLMLARGKSS